MVFSVAHMCASAILTMKTIRDLVQESLPSYLVMLTSIRVDMLPSWDDWTKSVIISH
jgi:hypothetical protein